MEFGRFDEESLLKNKENYVKKSACKKATVSLLIYMHFSC